MQKLFRCVTILSFVVLLIAMTVVAQDTTTTSTATTGKVAKTTRVESGEILQVSGNELIIKMANGEIRHITVAPGATAMVDGKKIGIKDAKPGMKLQRTITTSTIPQTVTTIRTIKGTVWNVMAPKSVILTLPDGTNKQYKVPKNQVFMIGGEKKTVFDLRKGMEVTATVLTETPLTEIAEAKGGVSGTAPAVAPPPAPAPPPPDAVVLVEEVAYVEEAPAPSPAKLPKTGSEMPLVGLIGMLMLAGSASLNLLRKR